MRFDGLSQPLFGFIDRSLGRSSAWLSSLAVSQFSTSCGYNHRPRKYLQSAVDADANDHPAPDLSSGSVESECLQLNANVGLLYCLGNNGGSQEEPNIGCDTTVSRVDLQGQTSREARHEGLNPETYEGFVVNAGNDRKPAKSAPSSGSGSTRQHSRLQKRIRRRQQSNDTPDDQLHRDRHGQDDDSGAETGRKLACPFFKHDRVRHFDCLPFTLKRVKDVKQHILRKHPAEQNSALSDNLKNPSSETAKWFAIWDVLFPHQRRPNSPFIENEVEEAIMMVKEFWDKHAESSSRQRPRTQPVASRLFSQSRCTKQRGHRFFASRARQDQ
ncbi:hypothetical protein K456DRAFT_1178837 [Colletotrichum gloeosporioides 23]|nr:hypothetical protein K456DRAFT_1178837 [Colletotrichum gloeosporioides 23]